MYYRIRIKIALERCFFFLFLFICQNFLTQYGYISSSRSGNHDFSIAIRKFQEFFGLKISGILDSSTVNHMKKPRCGVPDVSEGGRFRRYVTGGKWSKTHLTYFVQPGQDLPKVSIENHGKH